MAGVELVRNYRYQYIRRAEKQIDALYLGLPPERIWLISLIGAAFAALLLALITNFNIVLVATGTIAGFLIPRLYLRSLENRRRAEFDSQLLDALALIASGMRAGMSLLQAMEQVTREMGPPIRQEFACALQENRVGKPIIQALQDMKQRIRSEDLGLTVDAISIAQETGGVLSEILVKIADTIRRRNRIRSRIRTLTAQGRAQGIIMALMPWGLAAVLWTIDPCLIQPMFSTATGKLLLLTIAVLELAGWMVIRRMIAVEV